MDQKGRILVTIGTGILSGGVSYVTQRILAATGVLDPLAAYLSGLFMTSISPGALEWSAVLVVFLGLYGVVLWRVWRVRTLQPLYVQTETRPAPSMSMEVTRAAQFVPLHEAAVRLHEAQEEAGVKEVAVPSSLSPADAILQHCKWVFLTAARAGRITLWGKKLPSRNQTKIPTIELASYSPAPGTSRLNPSSTFAPVIDDVSVPESDLQAEIKYRIEILNSVKNGNI